MAKKKVFTKRKPEKPADVVTDKVGALIADKVGSERLGTDSEVTSTGCGDLFTTYVITSKLGNECREELCNECRRKEVTCTGCGGLLVASYNPLTNDFISTCGNPACEEGEKIRSLSSERVKATQRESGLSEWEGSTPSEYKREIDYTLLPDFNAYSEAIEYARGALNSLRYDLEAGGVIKPVLILYGSSGTAKSRCLHRIRRGFLLSGVGAGLVTGVDLCNTISKIFSSDATELERTRYRQLLYSSPLLCIDDFGKGRITERVAAQLYDLVEHRTTNKRLITVLTTNDQRKSFTAKVEDEIYADVIWRRFEDYSKLIKFS